MPSGVYMDTFIVIPRAPKVPYEKIPTSISNFCKVNSIRGILIHALKITAHMSQ